MAEKKKVEVELTDEELDQAAGGAFFGGKDTNVANTFNKSIATTLSDRAQTMDQNTAAGFDKNTAAGMDKNTAQSTTEKNAAKRVLR